MTSNPTRQDERCDAQPVREHHGCSCNKGNVTLVELDDSIKINADFNATLRPQHARYLAGKLYRLARKIERRAVVKAITPSPAPTPQQEG